MAMNTASGRSGGGRGRRQGSRRAPMADINVTPFVDVMLVLLIIFMVTAPLLVTGVPVELPESRANALDQKDEPIEILGSHHRPDDFVEGRQVYRNLWGARAAIGQGRSKQAGAPAIAVVAKVKTLLGLHHALIGTPTGGR